MKLKDLFENEEQHPGFLTDPKEIKQWLDDHYITNYTILPDGTVDVEGDVVLNTSEIKYILVQFNNITGDLWITHHRTLRSLKGCPSQVGGDFWCSYLRKIETLEGSPRKVNGMFMCSSNSILTSLKGGPKWVKKDFYFTSNHDTDTLDYAPLYIGGDFHSDVRFTQEDIPFTDLRGKFIHVT